MKFSLFYEMQIANPTPETERKLFLDCLEQAVFADELGFDGIWAVEHHGLKAYAHSSAPEIFLSFVAAKTKKIKIGHGSTLLPGKYNHPIRIAERIATLDILSEGRVLWGSAKSSTVNEREAFGIDAKDLEPQWLEALEMIPKMWREELFSWNGKYYDIPPVHVIPKPSRIPPAFASCSRPESAVKVGELGLGALNFAIYKDEKLKSKIDDYRQAIARCKPITGIVTNHFCCNPSTLVLKDDKKALQFGIRGSRYFTRAMSHYYWTEERFTGDLNIPDRFPSDEEIEAFKRYRNTPDSQLSAIIGDPYSARETVERFKRIGVDELIFVIQSGTIPHEIIMESLKTLAEEVLVDFK